MASVKPRQPEGRATVTKSIGEWLESIGLADYADRFAENAIDLSVVPDLTDEDLKELGVLLGHRRKILRAIATLNQATLASTAIVHPLQAEEAERRHLTVMFCDLVGSTALSERLDPEEMWRLLGGFQTFRSQVLEKHQGLIAWLKGGGGL